MHVTSAMKKFGLLLLTLCCLHLGAAAQEPAPATPAAPETPAAAPEPAPAPDAPATETPAPMPDAPAADTPAPTPVPDAPLPTADPAATPDIQPLPAATDTLPPPEPPKPKKTLPGITKKPEKTVSAAASTPPPADGSPDAVVFTVDFNGNKERFVVKLLPDIAPKTVENFKKNIESGFYNGQAFHRVIRNYLVQTGDPLSKDDAQKEQWGTTDIGQSVPAEAGGKHVRYAVAMAHKPGETNSSGSQFYITLRPIGTLDGSYSVFGEVISGTEVLNRMSGVIVDTNDVPLKRIEIVDSKLIRSDSKLAQGATSTGGVKKSKPDSAKGPIEKFIERVW